MAIRLIPAQRTPALYMRRKLWPWTGHLNCLKILSWSMNYNISCMFLLSFFATFLNSQGKKQVTWFISLLQQLNWTDWNSTNKSESLNCQHCIKHQSPNPFYCPRTSVRVELLQQSTLLPLMPHCCLHVTECPGTKADVLWNLSHSTLAWRQTILPSCFYVTWFLVLNSRSA